MTRKFHYIYASVSNFVHDLCGKFVLDLNGLHIIQNGDDYLLKLDYQIAVASHNPLHSFNTIIKLTDKNFDDNYQFKFIILEELIGQLRNVKVDYDDAKFIMDNYADQFIDKLNEFQESCDACHDVAYGMAKYLVRLKREKRGTELTRKVPSYNFNDRFVAMAFVKFVRKQWLMRNNISADPEVAALNLNNIDDFLTSLPEYDYYLVRGLDFHGVSVNDERIQNMILNGLGIEG